MKRKFQLKESTYKKRAKELKKNKIINFDLRKKLSPQQKAAITKHWEKEAHYIKGDYVKRHVSKKHEKAFKEKGFRKVGRSYWVPTDGYSSVHIRGEKIIKTKYEQGRKRTSIESIVPRKDIFTELEKLKNQPKQEGVFYTVRFGGNQKFNLAMSAESLLHYLKNELNFNENEDIELDEFIEGLEIIQIQ